MTDDQSASHSADKMADAKVGTMVVLLALLTAEDLVLLTADHLAVQKVGYSA
jgi:hypothetical protein